MKDIEKRNLRNKDISNKVLEIMRTRFLMAQGMKIKDKNVELIAWTGEVDRSTLAGMSLLSAFDGPANKSTQQEYYWDAFKEER